MTVTIVTKVKCKDMSTIAPIFRIKEDLDPFYLYGAEGEGDYNEPYDGYELYEPYHDVQVQVPAKQKLQHDTAIKEAKKKSIGVNGSRKHSVAELRSAELTEQRIDKHFEQLEDIFCKIFETLISISEDPDAFLPDGDVDDDRAQKRNRDFESRLKKSLFEANQQLINLRSTLLKTELHPDDLTAAAKSRSQLLQVLKLVKGNFQTYLQSISFPGCQVFSKAVKDLLQLTGTVTLIADLIRFNTRKVIEDVRRLSKFAARLNKKLELLKGNQKKRQAQKPRQAQSQKLSGPEKTELIKILAGSKFGPPGGEQVDSVPPSRSGRRGSRPVVIVPRQTKLTLDRAAFSKSKAGSVEAPPTPRSLDVISERFSNGAVPEPKINVSSPAKVASPVKRQFLDDLGCPSLNQKQDSFQLPALEEPEGPEFLELSEEELESIFLTKADFVFQEKMRSSRFLNDAKIHDVLDGISKDIVNNLVQKVCQEAFDSSLIDSFIQLELKPIS